MPRLRRRRRRRWGGEAGVDEQGFAAGFRMHPHHRVADGVSSVTSSVPDVSATLAALFEVVAELRLPSWKAVRPSMRRRTGSDSDS